MVSSPKLTELFSFQNFEALGDTEPPTTKIVKTIISFHIFIHLQELCKNVIF